MNVFDIRRLHLRYGPLPVLTDVSLSVRQGEVFGLLGVNGAGKSSLVDCLAGLRAPSSGTVRVCGLDPARERHRVQALLGVQPQAVAVPARLRVREVLDLYASFYPRPADWRALAVAVGLSDSLERPFARLSGGQKQRLSLALALVGQPRALILDEPTTGLDPRGRLHLRDLVGQLRGQGVTVLLVTHVLEEAERLCDRVAILAAGQVVAQGSPGELRRAAQRDLGTPTPPTFEQTYLHFSAPPALPARRTA